MEHILASNERFSPGSKDRRSLQIYSFCISWRRGVRSYGIWNGGLNELHIEPGNSVEGSEENRLVRCFIDLSSSGCGLLLAEKKVRGSLIRRSCKSQWVFMQKERILRKAGSKRNAFSSFLSDTITSSPHDQGEFSSIH